MQRKDLCNPAYLLLLLLSELNNKWKVKAKTSFSKVYAQIQLQTNNEKYHNEWSKWDSNIRNSESLVLFKKRISAFLRPFANSTFHCHNPKGLKPIARLRLGLSHLRFHKSKYSFQDTLNPICNCGTVEATVH